MDCVLGRESEVCTDSSDVTAEDPGGQAHGETHTGRDKEGGGEAKEDRETPGTSNFHT